jgi:(E)-4-hydroxy-3-methylbut-2-enyl-diphosphate synthase
VNPGNYTDSRKFAVREWSDDQYRADLERVEERFTPLVLKCKERGISMRIGTNHGSLSDRIMNRFGDTPEGMVESALEFVRICERHDYRDIIFSMKASNPKVMIIAYRLLAARMAELGMDYPFHLGVTEAGNAEDGRIKSAIGIGSLLEDGIGDTIRVSLTEEPEAEVPVAYAIANRYSSRQPKEPSNGSQEIPWDLYHWGRRPSREVALGDLTLGGSNVVAAFTTIEEPKQESTVAHILRWASPAGRRLPKPDGTIFWVCDDVDLANLRTVSERLDRWPQATLALIAAGEDPALLTDALVYADAVLCRMGDISLMPLAVAANDTGKPLILEGVVETSEDASAGVCDLLQAAAQLRAQGCELVLSLLAPEKERIHAYRLIVSRAAEMGIDAPILLHASASADPLLPESISIGSLLCDGFGDAIAIGGMQDSTELSYNILQAAGTRLSKTDYVACPSCGRTLFDLQETTDRIKQRTSHLVGVRLAIMGCIVNGPGEMADADFGYVGGAPGQVNLYVGKECVEKGVPAEIADDRLIELIKAHGRWEEDEDAQ